MFDKYITAVLKEADGYSGTSVGTVFFGGGTPTLLPPDKLSRLLLGLSKCFDLSSASELTVEANPKTLSEEKCRVLKDGGINRLSIGIQSFNDTELRLLGRIHDSACAKETILTAQKYFDNVSVDIMTSIPGQTRSSAMNSVKEAISLGAEHLSCYSLIIEEGTEFHRLYTSGRLAEQNDDEDRDTYAEICDFLCSAGFERYEISNFARPGRRCLHNMKYWRAEEYIGLGAAAHSYLCGARFSNTPDIYEYIENPGKHVQKIILTENDKISEYNMLALRTADGIDKGEFLSRFGKSFEEMFGDKEKLFENAGLMKKTASGCALTSRGMDVSNSIMCEFII